jgi:hypothetical protein
MRAKFVSMIGVANVVFSNFGEHWQVRGESIDEG